jgi:hypothetical protein
MTKGTQGQNLQVFLGYKEGVLKKMLDGRTAQAAHLQKKLPSVHHLAASHGITLPKESELPATYSMRKWLTRRLATLNGRHKAVWQSMKSNPQKLEAHRDATRRRMQRLRQKQKESLNTPEGDHTGDPTLEHTISITFAWCPSAPKI